MTPRPANPVEIGLTAAVVAMQGDAPQILVAGDGLPTGPFDPLKHRSSTHSATAGGMRAKATPGRMWCRSAISR